MLRLPEQVASFGRGLVSVRLRPRIAHAAPVLPATERAIAVRGHARTGNGVALIATATGVSVISVDRRGRRRVRQFIIPEILSIEEHRAGSTSELQLVTATSTVSVVEVETAQAWAFCRELRALILGASGARVRLVKQVRGPSAPDARTQRTP